MTDQTDLNDKLADSDRDIAIAAERLSAYKKQIDSEYGQKMSNLGQELSKLEEQIAVVDSELQERRSIYDDQIEQLERLRDMAKKLKEKISTPKEKY